MKISRIASYNQDFENRENAWREWSPMIPVTLCVDDLTINWDSTQLFQHCVRCVGFDWMWMTDSMKQRNNPTDVLWMGAYFICTIDVHYIKGYSKVFLPIITSDLRRGWGIKTRFALLKFYPLWRKLICRSQWCAKEIKHDL